RRHTRSKRDWSSDVCSSDLLQVEVVDLSEGVIGVEAFLHGGSARHRPAQDTSQLQFSGDLVGEAGLADPGGSHQKQRTPQQDGGVDLVEQFLAFGPQWDGKAPGAYRTEVAATDLVRGWVGRFWGAAEGPPLRWRG